MAETGFFKTYKLTVDTKINVDSEKIVVSQNDLNSAQLLISITQDGEPLLLDKVTLKAAFEKPDKTLIYQKENVTVKDAKNGIVSIVLTSQTIVAVGDVLGEIHIETESARIVTRKFRLYVERSYMSDTTLESTNEYTIIAKALELGEKFKNVDFDPIIKAGELAAGALPKTGGTMTGNVDMDISVGSKSKGYRWRDAAGALYGIESATDGALILYDYKNLARVWQYDPVAKRFTVLSDTNLLKTTGGTMTGTLGIERGSAEMAVVFKKAGVDTTKLLDNDTITALYSNDTKETIWRYVKATKTFDVVASNTNLVTKTKDSQVDLVVTANGEAFDTGTPNVARRRGNTVTIRIALKRKAGSTDNIVATIPPEMRPSTFMVTNALATDGTVVRVTVEAAGNIKFSATDKSVYDTITYVVD